MPWDSARWDAWYDEQTRSAERDAIVAEAFGLPAGFGSNNLLPWAAADRLGRELNLTEGQLLVDLACGRGAWGLELAIRSGAKLLGVDWSAVALGIARRRAATAGLDGIAEFRLGTMDQTAVGASKADAVLCLDSIQFAQPMQGALLELHRILRPGGRVVLTTWEPGRRGDERLDPRIRVRDLGAELANAGFIDVCVCEQAEWYEQERRLWRAVAAVDDPTDAAVRSLRTEARAVLETFDQLRRVLVTGRKPG